jgi:dCTP deaminase
LILNDRQILQRKNMIDPMEDVLVRRHEDTGRKMISYGLSSFGYDIRLGQKLLVCKPVTTKGPLKVEGVIDPKAKNQDEESFYWEELYTVHDSSGEWAYIPAYGFALGNSVERFEMPDDVVGVCVGKSTYARCGLIVNVTPLEPGWEGYLTLELHNTTPRPIRVYINEGIAQIMFHQGERPSTTYKERDGKYQDQPAHPVFAKV